MAMEACLTGTAANITSKIWEYSVEPLWAQLGYLFSYGSNVNNLRSKIQDLEDTKASLQHTIDLATRRGEEIKEPVTKWLADANNISETVGEFLNDGEGQLAKTRCSSANYFFPNLLSRHRLSRKAKKMAQSVLKSKLLAILVLTLGNSEIRSIGVYGIAGIGKTTLVKAVAKEALHAKLFSDAVEVTVSQFPNLEQIQKKLQIDWVLSSKRMASRREHLN
ncbi:hypothetical protein FNV43_RR00731 [Rhamnella rubrinervis]|uniref:NB-ARC domain-containing protein n=1 Tax=Rhamnella rubrinervis TaxID=2594499 RepID=A0A8K0HR76_9ROSA|nr:hypothetical protein FNV43_RR00731 [Rhamnella rubrinervis]